MAKPLAAAGILTVAIVALVLWTPPTAADSVCLGGGKREGTSDNGQHYEHWIEESCVVRADGTNVCAFYYYNYQYEADNQGADGWTGHTTVSKGGQCTGDAPKLR